MPQPLTLLVGLGLVAALAYLPLSAAAPTWWRSAIKTTPLAALCLAALLAGGSPFLVAALFFSALGDLALSRRGEAAFVAGLSSFALAHLSYVVLFLGLSGAPIWAGFAAQPLLALALVGLAVSAEFWLVPHVGKLRWPVRFYVGVITLMGLAAIAGPPGLMLGALLFILSDVLLAVQMFRLHSASALSAPLGWLVWSFYIAGQALIFAAAL